MKVAILADSHAGVGNSNPVFIEHQIKFFEEIFFPYIETHQIEHMIHLGDIFDCRRQTNNFLFSVWDQKVFSRWETLFKEVHIIVGNHDTYYKNTNRINTPKQLLSSKFNIYSEPQELDLYGIKTLMLPWICDDNEARSKELINSSLADLVLGHLEIIGVPMFKGIENTDKGFEQSIFKKFKKVLSGHFHLKSTQKNIEYLGSPYSCTWSEAFDSKGFHVMDTETLKLSFIENPINPYVVLKYTDKYPHKFPELKGKIVRVIVDKKKYESRFLDYIAQIEDANPASIEVQDREIEPTFDTPLEEHLDLFSMMDKYVESLDLESSKDEVKSFLRGIYLESVSLHDISE